MNPSPKTAQTRDHSVDILRGFAIFGVAFIHGNFLLRDADPSTPILLQSVYFRFAVPLFIILTSLFGARSLMKPDAHVWTYTWARWKKIFIQYAAWSALYFLKWYPWKGIGPSSFITTYVLGYCWQGQYFFILLLQTIPLLPFLIRVRWPGWSVPALLLASGAFYFLLDILSIHQAVFGKIGHRPIVYWLGFLILGVYLAQNPDILRSWTQWATNRARVWLATALTLAAPLLIVLDFQASGEASVDAQPYLRMSVLLASLVVFFCGLAAAQKLRLPWMAKLGQQSLGIFCLNPAVVLAFSFLFHSEHLGQHRSPYVLMFAPLVTVPLVVATCYGIALLLKRIGLGFLVS